MTELIVLGVASSFTASCVFLFMLSALLPKIIIAENIAKDVALNGKNFYVIKVMNRAYRDAVDIRAELRLMTYQNTDGGHIVVAQNLELTLAEIFLIKRYKKGKRGFAYQFSTYEDIDEKWASDSSSYLSFRIYVKDSLSSFGKVFSREFRTKTKNIVSGRYSSGESTDIY